jgi:serine/threonine protein kinase
MSVTQTTPEHSQSEHTRCSRCGTPLPVRATFCGVCGERVEKNQASTPQPDHSKVSERYRITTLIRRQPYVQLFFATDTYYQRPVVIREIDLSSLDQTTRQQAIAAAQQEYDLLRQERIPNVTPVIDLRYSQGHLYVISGWPFTTKDTEDGKSPSKGNTLDDLLQSGIGRPSEEIALQWLLQICQALQRLHRHGITLGDLDPHTIMVSENSYAGQPALMVSWLPPTIRRLLRLELITLNPSKFSAPEVRLGQIEPSSDIYSLGAILYLLLTSVAPDEPKQRKQRGLRSPRDLNSRVSNRVDAFVMHALALNSQERFQDAGEMAAELQALTEKTKEHARPGSNKGTQKRNRRKTTALANSTASTTPNESSKEDDEPTVSIKPQTARRARALQDQLAKQPEQQVEAAREAAPKPESTGPKRNTNGKRAAATTDIAELATVPPNTPGLTAKELARRADISELTTISPDTPGLTAEELAHQTDVAEIKTVVMSKADIDQHIKRTDAPPDDSSVTETATDTPNQHDEEEQDDASQNGLDNQLIERFKRRVSSILPAIPRQIGAGESTSRALVPWQPPARANEYSFLQRIQRFILGVQTHSITAAAVIETPLRVQPYQGYTLRINIMGRDEPELPPNAKPGTPLSGLSAFGAGSTIRIEVRSALFQNYAYIIQKADVQIPQHGYAAEISIPLQALSKGSTGRRERLHIFFMDETRQSLYEKPFVIELFISPHVQSGLEGHNVLTIPF